MSVIITNEWLVSHASEGMGWTNRQLGLIGVQWPLKKGWKQQVIGKVIDDETAAKFAAAKKHRQLATAKRTTKPLF